MKNRKGFTLIELLVVIAIIGILSTLAVVSLNTARTKSRNAKVLSDMKQLQTALELYYGDLNGYPSVATATALGGASTAVLSGAGFTATGSATGTTYMGKVPATPNSTAYNYCSATSAAPTTCAASTQSYMIVAALEGSAGGYTDGITVTPTGIAD